jgi:hypothetical protein
MTPAPSLPEMASGTRNSLSTPRSWAACRDVGCVVRTHAPAVNAFVFVQRELHSIAHDGCRSPTRRFLASRRPVPRSQAQPRRSLASDIAVMNHLDERVALAGKEGHRMVLRGETADRTRKAMTVFYAGSLSSLAAFSQPTFARVQASSSRPSSQAPIS